MIYVTVERALDGRRRTREYLKNITDRGRKGEILSEGFISHNEHERMQGVAFENDVLSNSEGYEGWNLLENWYKYESLKLSNTNIVRPKSQA